MKIRKLLSILACSILFLTACGGGSDSGDKGVTNQHGLNVITEYANSDGSTQTPNIQDYLDAGVQGVTSENLATINQAIKGLTEEDVDTRVEIQDILKSLGISVLELDLDNDGIVDNIDNCPNDYNPDQKNTNNNDLGDVCDITTGEVDVNTWLKRSDSTGIRVWETGIAYDPATKRIIQHGGHDFGDYVQTGYTRLLNSATGEWSWSQAPVRPQRRCITELAYIDSVGKVITINGRTSHGTLPVGGFSPDQKQVWRKDAFGPWLYDAKNDNWQTALDTIDSDLLYGKHGRIAYDASSDAVFSIQDDGLVAYFVHQNRTILIPVPQALHHRVGYAMAVDPITRKLVIFGGTGAGNYNWAPDPASSYEEVAHNDTWVLDLETLKWQEIITAEKPAIGMPMLHHLELPMIFHPPSGRLLLVQTPVNTYEPDPSKWPDTNLWSFDTHTMKWELVNMSLPLRFPPLLTYDSDRDFVVAVGGDDDAKAVENEKLMGIPHDVFVTGSDALFEARIQIPSGNPVASRPIILKARTTINGNELTWASSVGAVDIYRASKGEKGIFPGQFILVSQGVKGGEYIDNNLGTAYAYMIKSSDKYQWSTTAYVTPPVPLDLTAKVDSATSVTLNWKDDTTVKGWNVYRSKGTGSPTLITTAPVTQPFFIDTLDVSDIHHHYFIRAIGHNNALSGNSVRVHTAPQVPENFSVKKITDTKYRIQWSSPEPIQLSYSPIHKNTFKWNQQDILNWWNSWTLIGDLNGGDVIIDLPDFPTGKHVYFHSRHINALGGTGFYSDIVSPTDERFFSRVNND